MTSEEYDKAEEMYLKSLSINDSIGFKEGMADNYSELGILY